MLLPFFTVGPGEICGILLALLVEVKEQEDDGKWNHLLFAERVPAIPCGDEDGWTKIVVSGEVYISVSQSIEPLPFAEGERFYANVIAKCDSGFAFKVLPVSGLHAQYRVWTCNAIEIRLPDGRSWKDSHDS